MSDPVSKTEIEDVLSSIRRLVSEESWTEPRRTMSPEPAEHGRLVLTPSLRVADTSGPQTPGETQPVGKEPRTVPEDGEAPESTDAAATAARPTGSVAFLLEPEDATGDLAPNSPTDHDGGDDDTAEIDAGPAGEDVPWSDPSATLFASARSAIAAPQEDSDDEAGTELDFDAEDTGEFDDGDEDAQQDDPEPEAAAIDMQDGERADTDPCEDADFADDPAPAPAPEIDLSAPDLSAQQDHDDPDPEIGQDAPDHASDERPGQVPDEPSEAIRAGTLSAKIQALEAAIGRTRDQWEPDGTGMDDYAGTPVETIEWEDHDRDGRAAPDDPAAGRDGPAPADTKERAADVLSSEEAFLDEDSLRELVADIVREELQGALGERITRNVRKLVRREIHRALTAQELD